MRLHNAGIFGSLVSSDPVWDSAMDRYREDVIKYAPSVVVVFLGTNDLGHEIPLETFRKNYSSMLSDMKKNLPNSTIVAVGLLRRQDFSFGQIRMYSDVIAKVAKDNSVHYIDPYYWLDLSDFQDVVHPSVASQRKLTDKLYEVISAAIRSDDTSK